MKRGFQLLSVVVLFGVLSMSFVSAGLFDDIAGWFGGGGDSGLKGELRSGSSGVETEGVWVEAWRGKSGSARNCVQVCEAEGMESEANERGQVCTSGEATISDAVEELGARIFKWGCWPYRCGDERQYYSDAASNRIVGAYCYKPDQKRDYDGTDAIAACHCVGERDPGETSCTDSDGGKDYFVKGISEGDNSYDGPKTDFCFNFEDLGNKPYEELFSYEGTGVIEHYCNDYGGVGNEGYECPDRCVDGKCIVESDCSAYDLDPTQCIDNGCRCEGPSCSICWPSTPETLCTDSDDGLNYEVKGTTGSGVNPKYEDYCPNDASDEILLTSSNFTKTVSVGGSDYSVELVSASDTSATIKVDGDAKEISEGQSKVVGGVQVYVKSADESNLLLTVVLKLAPVAEVPEMLVEYTCRGEDFIGVEFNNYICPNGCVGGACIGESQTKIQVKKGWNLVAFRHLLTDPLSEIRDKDYKSMFIDKGIRAAFYYDVFDNEVKKLYPFRLNNRIVTSILEVLSRSSVYYGSREPDITSDRFQRLLHGAFWAYSFEDQEIELPSSSYVLDIENTRLNRGWNFLSVSEDFMGKSLNEWKGDCQVIKVALWSSVGQGWDVANGEDLNNVFGEDLLDRGLAMNVIKDCKLGDNIVPPSLPEIEECTDDDNGINLINKGVMCVGDNCFEDYCSNDNMLYEYFCDEKGANWIERWGECEDGKLVFDSNGYLIEENIGENYISRVEVQKDFCAEIREEDDFFDLGIDFSCDSYVGSYSKENRPYGGPSAFVIVREDDFTHDEFVKLKNEVIDGYEDVYTRYGDDGVKFAEKKYEVAGGLVYKIFISESRGSITDSITLYAWFSGNKIVVVGFEEDYEQREDDVLEVVEAYLGKYVSGVEVGEDEVVEEEEDDPVEIVNESVALFSDGEKLYVNDVLNKVVSVVTKGDMPNLLDTQEFDGRVYASITQTIEIGDNPRLEFKKQPTSSDDPNLGFALSTTSSKCIYESDVRFNKAVDFTHSDSIGEPVTFFGKNYVVGASTDSTHLALIEDGLQIHLNSDDPVEEVEIDDEEYFVEIVSASDTAATVKVRDDSGASETKEVSEWRSKQINGLIISVESADETNLRLAASLIVGSNKMILEDGSSVTSGISDNVVRGTLVEIDGGVNSMTKLSVCVVAPSSDKDAIVEGESFVDPVFGTFGVDFVGLNGNERDDIEIYHTSDSKMEVRLRDNNGRYVEFGFATSNESIFDLRNGDNNIVLREGQSIRANDYVVLGNENEGSWFQLTRFRNSSATFSSDEVVVTDIFTGDTYETAFSSEGRGTFLMGGKSYGVRFESPSSDGGHYVYLDYPDSHSNNDMIVYPSIETFMGAKVMFYEPLEINVDDWDGQGNRLENVMIPDGDGYKRSEIVDEKTTPVAGMDFKYNLIEEELTIHLEDHSGDRNVVNPALIIIEEKNHLSDYESLVVTLEPGASPDDGIGVDEVISSGDSSKLWWDLFSDQSIARMMDLWGTIIDIDRSDFDQKDATISYANDEVYANVYISSRDYKSNSRCFSDEIYNPYQDVCVKNKILCGYEGDDRHCELLEGQTGRINEFDLEFKLISAVDNPSNPSEESVMIEVGGKMIPLNRAQAQSYTFYEEGDIVRTIFFESVDGDSDKILGAGFDVLELTVA